MSWLSRLRRYFFPTAAEDRERGRQWAIGQLAKGLTPEQVVVEVHRYSWNCLDAWDWGAIDECRSRQ